MRISALICLLVLVSSCTRYQGSDLTEKEHPKLVEARELVQMQDLESAETLLLDFLNKNPDFALAHLQLGMVYQSKNEPINAVYHFQKYLEGRPESEKLAIIQQVIEDERRRLGREAGGLFQPAAAGSPEEKIQQLESKLDLAEHHLAVAELKLQQMQVTGGGAPAGAPPEWSTEKLALLKEINRLKSSSGSTIASGSPAQDSLPQLKTYTVKRGDTLSRISQKMYGEASQWRKIYQANRDRIPNQNALKLGVELVIPE